MTIGHLDKMIDANRAICVGWEKTFRLTVPVEVGARDYSWGQGRRRQRSCRLLTCEFAHLRQEVRALAGPEAARTRAGLDTGAPSRPAQPGQQRRADDVVNP